MRLPALSLTFLSFVGSVAGRCAADLGGWRADALGEPAEQLLPADRVADRATGAVGSDALEPAVLHRHDRALAHGLKRDLDIGHGALGPADLRPRESETRA